MSQCVTLLRTLLRHPLTGTIFNAAQRRHRHKRLPPTFTVLRSLHLSQRRNAPSHYEVLSVPRSASTKEIKQAYIDKAKQFHPDVNKTESAKKSFQAIAVAYEILSDEVKRRDYDTGDTHQTQQTGGHGGRSYSYRAPPQTDPEELFRNIFREFGHEFRADSFARENMGRASWGETRWGSRPTEEVIYEIPFLEAACGTTRYIDVVVPRLCFRCAGNGCEPGSGKSSCFTCKGTGTETWQHGPFTATKTCESCEGSGLLIDIPCSECQGSGKSLQPAKVTVNIPAGVQHGQSLRVSFGEYHFMVEIRVLPSSVFTREGDDVHCDVDISLSQAVFGGTQQIQTLNGFSTLEIPPCLSDDGEVRLRGSGFTSRFGNGDLVAHFHVKIPTSLSPGQRKALLEYAKLEELTPGTIHGVSSASTSTASTLHQKSQDSGHENIVSRGLRWLLGR